MVMYETNPSCAREGRQCQRVAIGRTMHFRVDGTATWEDATECRVCRLVMTTNGSNALGVATPEARFDLPSAHEKIGEGG